jgi:membrane-associated protease RseP (regulator of RpoE activity)
MSSHRSAAPRRLISLAALLLAATAAASAQTACPVTEQVGWLGIDGIECSNCEFGPGYARFSTEPRVTSVAPGSPAMGQLRAGDLIVSVNGALITTEEGASRYTNAKPGQDLTVLVRRDGQLVTTRFTNIPGRCPSEKESRPAFASARARRGGALTPPPVPPSPPGARVGGFGGRIAMAGPGPTFTLSRVSRVVFGFGISCSDCTMQVDRSSGEATLVWVFKSPPELYSVEVDGPAWKAGLRRGDVITQIDGIEITKEQAGRRFGAVQPGENVRFTYRRGNESQTVSVTAGAPAGVVSALSPARLSTTQTEESLTRMRQLLTELAAKERQEQALIDQLRHSGDDKLNEALQKYRTEQADQLRKLREIQAQLTRTEVRVRELAPVRAAPGRGGMNPNANTIRYSGELGNIDIEIRGSRPVVVDESVNEIIIRTGDAEIRLKRRAPR